MEGEVEIDTGEKETDRQRLILGREGYIGERDRN